MATVYSQVGNVRPLSKFVVKNIIHILQHTEVDLEV